jgi:hypothetical protein
MGCSNGKYDICRYFSIIVTPHYIIVAAVEVTLLIIIIVNSWNWTIPESESYQEG